MVRSNEQVLHDGLPDYYDPDNAANQPVRGAVDWEVVKEGKQYRAEIDGLDVRLCPVEDAATQDTYSIDFLYEGEVIETASGAWTLDFAKQEAERIAYCI